MSTKTKPTWTLVSEQLPPEGKIVIASMPQAGVRLTMLKARKSSKKQYWSDDGSYRQLDYFRAWAFVPDIDV